MNILISGSGLVLTPAIKEYIEEKLGSCEEMLARFEHGGDSAAHCVLARTSQHHTHGEVYRVEVTLGLPGKTIHVAAEHSDARAAVDAVKDLLRLELRKHKEKTRATTVRKSKKNK